jgi:hypothetical protein
LPRALVESFVAIGRDGKATIYVGKVDLGTGTRTALAQIAADELDIAFDRVTMVMGDTGTTPDQWLTGANLTIAQGGAELRLACATARAALIERASARLGIPAAELTTADGSVRATADASRSIRYTDLVGDTQISMKVDPKAKVKAAADYKVVGKSIARVDIPAKVTGEFEYIQDVRIPGMLHARVIRPERDRRLAAVVRRQRREEDHGLRAHRARGDFLAVIAKTEWGAIKAMRAVTTNWGVAPGLPEQAKVFDEWRAQPVAKQDVTQKIGEVEPALAGAARRIEARYDFSVRVPMRRWDRPVLRGGPASTTAN